MKILAFLSLLLATASCYPVVKTWTLRELSDVLERDVGDTTMRPYYERALNEIMLALFTGKDEKFIHAVIPSPSGAAAWTRDELENAINDPNTKSDYKPAIMQAHAIMLQKIKTGEMQESAEVAIPALDISTWPTSDLYEALKDPCTESDLIPYLERAHTELKQALENGENPDCVHMVTPVGLIPNKSDYELLPKPSKRLIKKTKKGLL